MADWIGGNGPGEGRAGFDKAVEIRCLDGFVAEGADCVRAHVVGKEENEIERFLRGGETGSRAQAAERGEEDGMDGFHDLQKPDEPQSDSGIKA